MNSNLQDNLSFDQEHIFHPYAPIGALSYMVESASGVYITLIADNKTKSVVDGISSWWTNVHGYNHPLINAAIKNQLEIVSHVMFGGLTHKPAIELARKLIAITSPSLTKVFFSDSGSVAVEVALKMSLQYWLGLDKFTLKTRFLTVKGGYHGDTFTTMSISSPDTGIHTMFKDSFVKHIFADRPEPIFNQDQIDKLEAIMINEGESIAALIIEPLVQGAGGMKFYSIEYLKSIRQLCNKYKILLILDEIATGFWRTGKMFAYEHANITPDILCVGKALTGGHLSLAATICTDKIAASIEKSVSKAIMHGPTYMANPLACAAACTSLELMVNSGYDKKVSQIAMQMDLEFKEIINLPHVKDVRVMGAIGVIEFYKQLDTQKLSKIFVELGVLIRPFSNIIYLMPAYTIMPKELSILTKAIITVTKDLNLLQFKNEDQEMANYTNG